VKVTDVGSIAAPRSDVFDDDVAHHMSHILEPVADLFQMVVEFRPDDKGERVLSWPGPCTARRPSSFNWSDCSSIRLISPTICMQLDEFAPMLRISGRASADVGHHDPRSAMARMLGSKAGDVIQHDHLAGLVHLVDGIIQRR
jgi:hypothetical protein